MNMETVEQFICTMSFLEFSLIVGLGVLFGAGFAVAAFAVLENS